MRQEGRRVRRIGGVGLAVALALVSASCGSSSSTPTTTTPTVARTTDTFSGTVAVGGADFHSFPIAASGIVDVTLTTATPPSTIVMGLSVGLPGDGRCVALAGGSTTTAAGAAVQLSGMASPGTLCADVYDIGNQSAPVSYTLTVTHP
jgi:ABC-type phosphate transport system substrate-binding protein